MRLGVPARRGDPRVIINPRERAGYCEYDRRGKNVVTIKAPGWGAGAWGRVITLHEMIHANISSVPKPRERKYGEHAIQLREDLRVHSRFPEHAERDELVVAAQTLRAARGRELSSRYDCLRAIGIVYRAGRGRKRIRDLAGAYMRRLEAQIPGLGQLARDIAWRSYPSKPAERFALLAMIKQYLSATRPEEAPLDDAEKSDGAMTIVELPRVEDCDSSPARDIFWASGGARLNVNRAIAGMIARDGRPCFRRSALLPSAWRGVVLIDASISMNITQQGLNALCRSIPGGTVAYYGAERNGEGKLYVFARDGKRAVSPPLGRWGNEVDVEALSWMHRQPGPRVYVGDGQFCSTRGSANFAAAQAHSLASRADVWHRDWRTALAWFKAQGVKTA